jgi:cytochrome P450
VELTAWPAVGPVDVADVDLDEIDLYDPAGFRTRDQHPTWRTLRVQAPVWWHDRKEGTGFWCVTRYADCEKVVKDHRTFSSEEGTILASVGVGDAAGGQTITLTDPPAHALIRVPAMRALGHAMVAKRSPAIRAKVAELIEPCEGGAEVDFARLMRRLPMVLAGQFMDIPEELWDDVALWAGACIAPDDPAYALGESTEQTLRLAHHELFACFRELVRRRRANPGDDLVSMLIGITDHRSGQGRPLDDWRVLLNCYSFILGANTTTPNVAAHTMLALIERPEIWPRLTTPTALSGLVEEGVRWTSPTHHLVRRVSVDTTLGDTEIRAGDWVAAWVASANRDETVFDAPYTFDIDRSPNRHLGFGGGPHYCIGAPMSRLVLSVLFEELAGRFEGFTATAPPVHLHSNWINGLVSLPVRGAPRRRPAEGRSRA